MATDALARLVELYPKSFFFEGLRRRPLKIGIDADLRAAGTGLSNNCTTC
jgi:sRNA-binding protein